MSRGSCYRSENYIYNNLDWNRAQFFVKLELSVYEVLIVFTVSGHIIVFKK